MDLPALAASMSATLDFARKAIVSAECYPKKIAGLLGSLTATMTVYTRFGCLIAKDSNVLSSERSLHLESLLKRTGSILKIISEDLASISGAKTFKILSLQKVGSLKKSTHELKYILDDASSLYLLVDKEAREAKEWLVKLKPRYKQFLKRMIFKQETNGLITLPLNKARNQLHEDVEIQMHEFGDALGSPHTRKSTRDDSPIVGPVSLVSDRSMGLHLVVCDVHSKSIRPSNISFSERGFIRIMADFQLPGAFFHVLFTGTPVLLRLEDSTESYVMRTPLSNSENWTIALRYDDFSRTTFAVVHGFQPQELRCLLYRMDEFKASSVHPLLLPVLMCEMLIKADSSGIKQLAADLFAVENKTIWHGYWQPGQAGGLSRSQNHEQEFECLTRTLNRITTQLAFHEMRIETNFALISKLRIYVLDEKMKWWRSVPCTKSQALDQRLSNLQVEHNALLLEIVFNQKIANNQLQIVYNLVAQHNNKQSLGMAAISTQIAAITKEDSFAMRTIAVMTITFLPATAISSMFSMGMFNWQADGGDVVVSSRFWIYWAVSVPLTLSVLGLWLTYVHRHKTNEGEILSEKLQLLRTKGKEQHALDRQGKGLSAYISELHRRAAGTEKDEEFFIDSSGKAVKAATRTLLSDHQLPNRADTFLQGPLR